MSTISKEDEIVSLLNNQTFLEKKNYMNLSLLNRLQTVAPLVIYQDSDMQHCTYCKTAHCAEFVSFIGAALHHCQVWSVHTKAKTDRDR